MKTVVARADELDPGSVRIVSVGRRSIGVFNVAGHFHALLNACPHAGAPLCLGTQTGMSVADAPGVDVHWSREGEIVRCPWHGFEFDIATGRSITDPPLQARTFAVTVEDGLVVVDLDARA
jgi:3-phenylpropionate/trans-cinnamate dioxygenase ferredoxin subunit